MAHPHDRLATKLAAFKGIRDYGHAGLAEQLRGLKKPAPHVPGDKDGDVDPAAGESKAEALAEAGHKGHPFGHHPHETDPDKMDADTLEKLLGQR